jgi:hypothetical protein
MIRSGRQAFQQGNHPHGPHLVCARLHSPYRTGWHTVEERLARLHRYTRRHIWRELTGKGLNRCWHYSESQLNHRD